jgi:hypothetical protein
MNVQMTTYSFLLIILLFFGKIVIGKPGNSLLGHSGFIVVPSGYLVKDGSLTIGYCRVPRLNAIEYKAYERNVKFGSMGFLPFLEVTFAIVRPDNYPGGIGDRTVGFKFKLIGEKKYLPALSMGMHDFFGIKEINLEPKSAQHFAALYVVGSKSFELPFLNNAVINAGYGEDWFPARTHQLVGFFIGSEIQLFQHISAIAEYDADNVNFGTRLNLFNLQFLLAWWDMHKFSWNVSYSFMLHSL